MRAAMVTELGAPLRLEEAPTPAPGPGQVRIAVEACGINFADTLMVKGAYQEKYEPPFAPGLEVAGVIEALGDGVCAEAHPIGSRVMAVCGVGGLAEQALAPAAACYPIPAGMDATAAAAIPVAYGSSHVALDYKAGLRAGERLLVLGAAGGVGLTAVEIGALMGAEVVACARGAEKLETARAKGAAHLIDAEDGPDALREQVKALGGADVVYDPVGGEMWKAAFRAARFEARLLPIGFASGDVPQIPANLILVKNLTVIGFYWGAYYREKPEVLADSFRRLSAWFEAGALTPHVSDVVPLSEAQSALDLLRSRKAQGKVVVTP